MAMNLATRAKIKSQLAAKGIYWTDQQIESYAAKRKEEPQAATAATARAPYPEQEVDERGMLEMVGENVWDASKGLLWGAVDTGTFGLAGLAAKTIAPKTYESFQEELYDTMGGRMGSAIGSLAGFMVPMGAVARGTSAVLRGARGLAQAKKVKAGLEVAKPTTRTLQMQAAKEIMKASEKEAVKAGGKGLGWGEAKAIAKESSDNIIGFTKKGWMNKVFGKGPAYQMEHGLSHVNKSRRLMQGIMPERLAAGLSKYNIKLNEQQLFKLSDDVVELLGSRPFNSIETVIAGKYAGKFTAPIMNILGGVAQEAINFGIVGSAMDAVQYAKGDLDYSESGFWEKTMHHAIIGGAFGGVRFIPGGRNQKIWRDMVEYSGGATKKLNGQVAKMGLDEAKAFARMTMRNDKSVSYIIDGQHVSMKNLRKGFGIGESKLPALKNAIMAKNNETLGDFKNLGKLIPEWSRDIAESVPRMAAGTIAFNWMSLADEDEAFYNLHPSEAAFHLILGAVMTKSGRPLIHGKKARFGLGEKEYYYNSDLKDYKDAMDRAYLTGESIGDIVKQFDGNLFTDWIARNPIEEVNIMIDILEKNNVVYDRTKDGFPGLITPDTFNTVALKNRELLNLIDPIIPAMQAKNYEMNPNVKKADLDNALAAIKITEAKSLSTPERKAFLDSKRNVIKSIYEGASEKWTDIQLGLFDNLGQQMAILTDDPNFLRSDGRMLDFTLDDRGYSKNQKKVIRKLNDLRFAFQNMDIVKLEELSMGKENAFPVELSPEKIKRIEEVQDLWESDITKEFYGDFSNDPIDMMDGTMWSVIKSVDYQKNVARVHDVMMGKEVPGMKSVDVKSIRSLLHEALSHKENKNKDILVDTPEKITLDPEGIAEAEEYYVLKEMLNNLWNMKNASGSRPIDGREVVVPLGKARSLKEKLVAAGMPDPDNHAGGLDGRYQNWINKSIMHGMDQVLGGLDVDPYKAEAVRRLMMNGILQHRVDPNGRSLGLESPHELTIDQIENIMPNITREGAEKIRVAYDKVMDKLGTELVHPREDFSLSELTEEQLGSVLAADHLLEPSRIKAESDKYQEDLAMEVIGFKEDNSVLRSQLEDADPSAVVQIKAMMEHNERIVQEYSRVQRSFFAAFGSGVEMSRASAHLHYLSSMTDANGKTIMEHLTGLKDATEVTDFKTITEQIRDIQVAIANKVAERPDVRTWDDKRQEAESRRKQEDVEGHMPDDRQYITPDLFLTKHNISIDNVFREGEAGHGVTYDNASEVIYELYKVKSKEEFSGRLFELAGSNSKEATSELRNEVMHVSNLFERRFNVKRLAISGSGGIFENGDISKGYLTDIYSEIFAGETGDMLILSSDYFSNGRFRNIATNPESLTEITKVLDSDAFVASLQHGGVTNMKYTKDGRVTLIEDQKELYAGHLDLGAQHIKGRHYVIAVDENINLVIPEAGFHKLADSFVRWFETGGEKNGKQVKITDDPYVINSIKNMEAAGNLFKILQGHYDRLKDVHSQRGSYDAELFRDSGFSNRTEHMEDAMYTMFNVMYGKKIDADWLQDAYLDQGTSRKGYKYKRLAQNQGYSRNSRERQLLLEAIYKGTTDKRAKKLIKKYTDLEKVHVAVLEDGNLSIKGEDAIKSITDNRSVAEARLESMKGQVSSKDYDNMRNILRESDAMNDTEFLNGMTIVNRDLLDYLLLLSGQGDLIGESSGQKPVGLSSYTDSKGNMHVFYNKTHYFYDSRLDPFFRKNKDITQVALTSGTKKAKIIDKNDKNLSNKFEPISDLPGIDDGVTLTQFINGLKLKAGDKGVMPINFNETLSGTAYGKPKGARIMKQFDNWTSPKVQADLYEWARADMIDALSEVNIHLYNTENVGQASREAQSFIRTEGNKDGTMSTDAPNASSASIWIEAGGVPFSEMSKNLYDALIKRRHIDDAGVFDGFTDAGGVPVLRGNLDMDLNIPIYRKFEDGHTIQVKLGEAHVGAAYLDRAIHFKGAFGKKARVIGAPGATKLRPKFIDKSSLTVAFSFDSPEGKRDIIIDIKSGAMTDPLNENAHISQYEYKDLKKMSELLKNQIGTDKNINKFRDVYNELEKKDYKGGQLVIMATPAPRTGPHDAMAVKVKDMLDARDGGVMELNSYDVTLRGQRDYDTDKLPFYMDTPFSAVQEAYRENGAVLEAAPVLEAGKNVPNLDMYSNQSFKNYNENVQLFKRLRGPVLKMHRKLTYAERLFKSIDGLDMGDGNRLVFTPNKKKGQQRLVDDSQNILDIYDGTSDLLKTIDIWTEQTMFGNSHKSDTDLINIRADEPFFQIRNKEGTFSAVTKEVDRAIVRKVMRDFGRLLLLENNIYEAGEAKRPKYSDMVSGYRDFRQMYDGRKNAVDWSFYHYISKSVSEAAANELFFNNDPARIKDKAITPLFGELGKQVLKHPTPFLKSLYKAAEKDFSKVRETYGPSGFDYYNDGILKLMGEQRAEALLIFQRTGLDTWGTKDFNAKENLVKDMWSQFYKGRSHEEMMVQANTIETDLRRAEKLYEQELKKKDADSAYLEMQAENILIKSEALQSMLNKMAMGKGEGDYKKEYGQELVYYKTNKLWDAKTARRKNTIKEDWKTVAIRNKTTGDLIRELEPGKEWTLTDGQVAVYNPVTLKAVREHELIDGAAYAYSVLGRYSNIMEDDMSSFRNIVYRTKKEIRKSASSMMKRKGYRDWTEHQQKVQAVIDKGLMEIKELAMRDHVLGTEVPNDTWMGNMPRNKTTYGEDFLMVLLVPDYSGNPNELHYSPKTGNFLPATLAPKSSIINAVMSSIERYNVVPDYKAFVTEFAQVHRGFYEGIVAGRGMHDGTRRLVESDFESALINHTMGKVMNNTFMPRRDYKTMDELFDAMPPILSDYAELYRQILQEGALADPMTAFGLRRQIVEDPTLGVDAYKRIFQLARGHLVHDGFSARKYGVNNGEGQLIGEVFMNRNDARRRQITGSKNQTKGESIKAHINEQTGRENEKREECPW